MSDPGIDPAPPRRPRLPPRLLGALAVLLAVAAVVSVLVIPGKSKDELPSGVHSAPPAAGYEGTRALPVRQAPAIALRNYLGRPVTLASYRGKVVFVTFLYTSCPDVCPLIASNLRVALKMLGARAGQVQLIAVSVDPHGDTPSAVRRFLVGHGLAGRMQYLIGSAHQLSKVWSTWGVSSSPEPGNPELVAHSALVYGISAAGRLTTLYPAEFEPSEIVHDEPKLAAG